MKRKILVIDLKTFYASVECALLGLDPFRTNLVVADKERGRGTICLAVTPALKELGVKNRCRLFEIPDDIKYLIAKPKMQTYIEYSANIYAIYLKYLSKDDIYVYSIDECFLDVTNYLKLYKTDEVTLAKRIMKDIFETTHITATCGIGTNLFLAKVALDILSKHSPDNIGLLDEDSFNQTIIFHEPITDIWNIGRGTAKRLRKYGVKNLYGLQMLEDSILKKEFGVKGEILKDHAFGLEPTTIKEIKEYKPKSKSLSQGQVLFEDYSYDDAFIVLKEMADILILDLIGSDLACKSISIYVGYSKNEVRPTGGALSFEEYIDNPKKIKQAFIDLYLKTTNRNGLIRRINLSINNLISKEFKTISLFNEDGDEKDYDILKTIIDIQNKFGKSSVLRGIDLEEKATTRMRNKLIGGHNAK